ncbi:MAG: hypothetical protein GX838_06160 [Clostridiaceae bacterium]|nr:hypothetical protein [Clostridiaceae bacterium]
MTGPAIYQAVGISSDLRALLAKHPDLELVVHSVFKSVTNLLSAGQTLVTLASAGRDLMPMGLLVAPGLEGLALRDGQRLHYKEWSFYLPGPQSVRGRSKSGRPRCLRRLCEMNKSWPEDWP